MACRNREEAPVAVCAAGTVEVSWKARHLGYATAAARTNTPTLSFDHDTRLAVSLCLLSARWSCENLEFAISKRTRLFQTRYISRYGAGTAAPVSTPTAARSQDDHRSAHVLEWFKGRTLSLALSKLS